MLFLSASAVITYVLHQSFVSYTTSLAQAYIDSLYTVVPQSPFWYVPASILGTLAAFKLTYTRHGVWLPGRIRLLAFLLAVGSIALVYFGAHSSLRLAKNEIIFRRLWSFEEQRIPYSEVKALKEVHYSGDEMVVFVIEFKNAPEWTTAVEVVFPGEKEKTFLSERTGKHIEQIVTR